MDLQIFRRYLDDRDVNGRDLLDALNPLATDLVTGLPAARPLVTAAEYRTVIGQTPELWNHVSLVFEKLDEKISRSSSSENDIEEVLAITNTMARFVRNLVAGNSSNQNSAWNIEPSFHHLIYLSTSYAQSLTPKSQATTRMLAQMLSNIATGNDAVATSFWNNEMSSTESGSLLLRLLIFPDDGTKLATAVLILNCLKGSYRRSHQLSSTPLGIRLFITLLDQLELSLTSESEDAPRAQDPFFEVTFECMNTLIGQDLAGALWTALEMKDEPTTPHRIIFLKIIDAHLQSEASKNLIATASSFTFLLPSLRDLVHYARGSISRTLPPETRTPNTHTQSPPAPTSGHPPVDEPDPGATETGPSDPKPPAALIHAPDLKLPLTLNALVLVAQCCIHITLAESNVPLGSARLFVESLRSEDSLLENILDLLRLLDRLLPRILWGQAMPSPHQQAPSASSGSSAPSNPNPTSDDPSTGFAYVKRDLVRLVGILAYSDRKVQDRIRACGGIYVILNLCVVDERNPYLREHALFALNNVLEGNPENQAEVRELRPTGTWDSDGMLRDAIGGVRR